jgi:hypothetical protein
MVCLTIGADSREEVTGVKKIKVRKAGKVRLTAVACYPYPSKL